MCNTQRKETVHLNKQKGKAQGSIQYLLEKPGKDAKSFPPITADNHIELFICGQNGFGAIAQDIQSASKSIDMVCWGFDPGMMLVRSNAGWDEKQTFGYLLEQAAIVKKVKVRILVWYAYTGSALQNNMPGYGGWLPPMTTDAMDAMAPGGGVAPIGYTPHTDPGSQHWDYNVHWYQRNVPNAKKPGNISIMTRKGDRKAIAALMGNEKNKPSPKGLPMLNELQLLESSGTHHQKTLVFDYVPPNGGVGYVMGLNSVTDYWDTRNHDINDQKRESAHGPGVKAQGFTRKDPLQDYASRIRGSALRSVYENFAKAWERGGGKDGVLTAERIAPVGQVNVKGNDKQKAPAWKDAVNADVPSRGAVRLQVLRTQPEDKEKSIKAFYQHSSQVALNTLYLENQYFFYQEWADHLLESRKKVTAPWRAKLQATRNPSVKGSVKPQDMPLLHLFVVIPEPERSEMIPRTYDTLRTLGQEDTMIAKDAKGKEVGQDALMERRQGQQAAYERRVADYEKRKKEIDAARQHYKIGQSTYHNNPAKDIPRTQPQQPWTGVGIPRGLPKPFNPIADGSAAQSALAITKKSANELASEYGVRVSIAMLYTSGVTSKGMQYRPIYIHSKLLIVDDCSFTLGSANLNQRSMTVDSEINIACDCPVTTQAFRKAVFDQHTSKAFSVGTGQLGAKDAFDKWTDLMKENARIKQKGKKSLCGFLLPFKELRECETRYA